MLPAHVSIGEKSYYSGDAIFQIWETGENITIGKYCSIGRCVYISTGGDHNHSLVSTFPFDSSKTYKGSVNTVIGHDVWIGDGARVGGSQISHGAVIGGNAVVMNKTIPPYAIVIGNPGVVRKYRFDEDIIEALLAIAWWDWPITTVEERKEWFYKPVEEFVKEFKP